MGIKKGEEMKIKKAMRKYPIVKTEEDDMKVAYWSLGNKKIFKTQFGNWFGANIALSSVIEKFHNSKKQAVAWLIEGATKNPKPFSTVSMLNKSGHTIPAGTMIIESSLSDFYASIQKKRIAYFHKCPTCGKWHN